jgi:hypothetical protein
MEHAVRTKKDGPLNSPASPINGPAPIFLAGKRIDRPKGRQINGIDRIISRDVAFCRGSLL